MPTRHENTHNFRQSFSIVIIKSKSPLHRSIRPRLPALSPSIPTPNSNALFFFPEAPSTPLRAGGLDRRGGEPGAVLAGRGDGDLSLVVVAVQAGAAGGDEVVARLRDELDVPGGAVLGAERGSVEADADLLVHEVRTEAVAESTLNEKDVVAVPGGGGDLSVGSGVDAGSVDDFTWVDVMFCLTDGRSELSRQLTVVAEGEALVSGHAALLLEDEGVAAALNGLALGQVLGGHGRGGGGEGERDDGGELHVCCWRRKIEEGE